ncbi:MAG: tetratricopeptide repeat protein, partial [Pirellulaceae bacterium]
MPQPPSPSTVTSDVQIQTITTSRARQAISVFDIVESEPISEKPIGGQKPKEEPVGQPQPEKPATPAVSATDTTGQDGSTKPAEPAATVAETAPKPSGEKPVGTAIRPVEQQPVVRPTGPVAEKSTVTPNSRFGFKLKVPSTDKLQERLKSLITLDTGKTQASGQGGQTVRNSRQPGERATGEATKKTEETSPETPRVARKSFSFALPPIAMPRFGIHKAEEKTVTPGKAAVESKPAPDSNAITELDTPRPLQFQKLTPGRSSAADLKEVFGAAQSKSQENGVETLVFQIGAFQQVKVIVSDQIVDSIQVFFKESYSVSEIAKQLGIQDFEPVIVRDSRGSVAGSVYPERGVTFVYGKNSEPVQVKQIKLAPISPVPFLQRAQVNQRRHYQDALDDLVEVQRLDPKNEEAHAMESRILTQMGRFSRALEAVDTALQLQPGSHDYRLIRARIQSQLGDWEAAEKTIQQVLESEDATNLQQAEATCLQGDLYGRHGRGEYQVAIQHHLASVKRAKSLVVSTDRSVSRQAKQILLNAHLAIANDIAWGDWQNKSSVVPKWLDNSQALLNSLRKDSFEDAATPMYVTQQLLFVHLGLAEDADITETVRDLTKLYNELLDGDAGALFKQRIRWMAGKGFYCAGRIAQQQGKSQKALQYATDAFHLLTTVAAGRDFVPRQEILLGDTCFLLGSLQAVYKNDHWEAVTWYQQALKKYEQPAVVKRITSLGLHGERLVSMGLSFWQSEDHQRGLKLTRQGTD